MISKSLLRTSLLFSLALLMQSKIFGVDKSYESPTATKRTVSKRDFYAPLHSKYAKNQNKKINIEKDFDKNRKKVKKNEIQMNENSFNFLYCTPPKKENNLEIVFI